VRQTQRPQVRSSKTLCGVSCSLCQLGLQIDCLKEQHLLPSRLRSGHGNAQWKNVTQTDSTQWCLGRARNLKQKHPQWCISPCPRNCKAGCSACIASWLLDDSCEIAPVEELSRIKPAAADATSAGNKLTFAQIWCCPVLGCSAASDANESTEEWPVRRSKHLKLDHPTWCVSPCPQNCLDGCSSCIAAGLLHDPGLNRTVQFEESSLGGTTSLRADC